MRPIELELPALDEETPVAMFTVTVPVAFAAMDSVDGLKLQEELAGKPVHEKVKVPLDPPIGITLSV